MQSQVIRNRERAKQLLAFDGMQYGRCRPTDIDLSIDFDRETFIFVEIKGKGSDITVGQRIHLEALVDGLRAGGRDAVAILATHNTPDPEADVHVGKADVLAVYDGFQWVDETPAEMSLDSYMKMLHSSHLLRQKEKQRSKS